MKVSSVALALLSISTASCFSPSYVKARRNTSLKMSLLSISTGRAALDPDVVERYASLAYPKDKVLAEYVWVDAAGNTRSKTRTLSASKIGSVDLLPKWNFDGR